VSAPAQAAGDPTGGPTAAELAARVSRLCRAALGAGDPTLWQAALQQISSLTGDPEEEATIDAAPDEPAPVLIITRGHPASGKSTRAIAWVAERPERRARVNRDCLRAMMHGGRLGTAEQEAMVTAAQHTSDRNCWPTSSPTTPTCRRPRSTRSGRSPPRRAPASRCGTSRRCRSRNACTATRCGPDRPGLARRPSGGCTSSTWLSLQADTGRPHPVAHPGPSCSESTRARSPHR
jgi:hypothetical protein